MIENPVQGDRIVFRETAQDTGGKLLRMEVIAFPQASGPVDHIHLRQEERFEILSGTLNARLNNREQSFGPGETLTIPPGTPHCWWNGGTEETRVLCELRPVLNTETFFETIYGLARDGKTNKEGVPNLLQIAAMSRLHRDEIYLARPPIAVQRVLFALLSPIARLLGYRSSYPEYSEPGRHR